MWHPDRAPVQEMTLTDRSSVVMQQALPLLRAASSWILSRTPAACAVAGRGALGPGAEGAGIFRNLPWRHQQVRSVKRGAEYQPKNIKRMRTHGWDRRVRTRGGIEVILRRMLKGRKSLTV
ncbi:39S ribosomal protein L34, mitochondrial isoform X2 [Anguilla anguilla]|uniref:39S ribosomal protein L34, mitochondrial isoform X2 n=1 Tax=Anguilla anguilla TaxID=7936 RepID=UPI0015AEDDE3|nr:39S ribosomal protein L34, mitochondrial isoform X2 [Anguilla anguilla]